MMTKLFKNFKSFKSIEQFKIGFKTGYVKSLIKSKPEVKKLIKNICLNDTLMMSKEKLIAMLYRDENFKYTIVTDNHFEKLSKNTQEYIVYHEIGHYLINPLFNNILSLEEESKADSVAFACIGVERGLKAMNELYSYIAKYSVIGAAEIGVRLSMLGFDISSMYMETTEGILYGDQFHLIFEERFDEIIFK